MAQCLEKLFFNKGSTRGLILSGQGNKQDCFPEKMIFFFCNSIFWTKKIGLPRLLATVVNLPNIAGGLHNLGKMPQ
jgi:hypothetical protein